MMKKARDILIVGGLLLSAHVCAHHSTATFDLDTSLSLEGRITSYEWRNPHVYLTIESVDGTRWLLETDSVAIMTRSGWSRETFAVGDLVSARFNPDRDADNSHGLLLSVRDSKGGEYVSLNRFRDRVDYDSDARPQGLSGVWQGNTAMTVEFMRQLNSHPLTAAGAAARQDYSERLYPTAQCIAWPTPFFFAGLYLKEIEVSDEQIVMRSELFSAERIIHLDRAEFPADAERSVQGYSIGRWDGDSLVIDTRYFADHRSPIGHTGIPSGSRRRVVERLTLDAETRTIAIDIELDDPEFLSTPMTGRLTLHYTPHLEMLDVDCELEVATRFLQ